MASGSAVSSTLTSRDYHCKVCNLYLDSGESLDVHLQYHKENLYVKWGAQNGQNDTENNNGAKVRSETTVTAPADSSEMITKPSPEFQQRATPETSAQFPHPATPQSYHSAPSPYQNADQTSFSPGTQYAGGFQHTGFSAAPADQLSWEPSYNQEYKQANRFHPYNMQERVSQVSSSSPIYGQPLNQPTPSPSPNQCDKCGYVCDSVVQLNEHCNSAHAGGGGGPNSVPLAFQQFPPKQYNNTGSFQNDKIKEEQEESSDILDLDSHKVVYQGNEGETPNTSYDESSSQVRESNTRTVPLMPWETKLYSSPQVNGDISLFKDQKMFAEQKSYPADAKMFHGEQKFGYSQDKFMPVHGDQKPFLHVDQKLYPGVQMPPLGDYPGAAVGSNASDLKPPYRPYDSPNPPQITSTQPPNPSSALPSIGSKGANWKSNEARRPKTYNCTACNKWFTSSGHLKRHYNTTLHKNAVRSSGQPDPATMPISTHHHPSRDSLQNRGQQQSGESNTRSPAPDDSRGDDAGLQSPYAAQTFERSHRVAALQSKSQYAHLSQGNIENNFSNNPLANHSLQHQVGSHPINIGSQPPGLIVDGHIGSKGVTISSNPPNGEAGPSAPNHHMRDLLSVSTSNIITPVLTQNTPALTAHPLPPFSHLGVNPYSPRSTDPLGAPAPSPTPQLFINQNFQQSIAPSYPNGIAPHVTDTVINSQLIASPATSGECSPEVVKILKQETLAQPDGGRLPSFSQFHTQRFDNVIKPNVGGQFIADDTIGSFIYSNSVGGFQSAVDVGTQNIGYDLNIISKSVKDNVYTGYLDNVKNCHQYISYTIDDKSLKNDNLLNTKNGLIQILKIEKIENLIDYANKENYGDSEMTSPSRPESAGSEQNNNKSGPALAERSLKKAAADVVHKCLECDKLFNKACYLTQHNKTFHSGAKPFKCDRCGKRFPDGATYETHYLKHAHDKPFKCPECPKSFNHKTDLRRHMCLHSGSKPFSCKHCGKGFIRQDHMMKHFETHKKKIMRSSMSSMS
ncbi:uncharacterized protein LOC121738990 [Aricia agestis]|uniref:uncharacterized protein LOC121738990 n=1 Tax=Aricia agestis TaxID=91739 RepID=UPI001C202AE2|nr:uncharacterized protein LOC121738990 [Aricia agestis]